MPVAKRAAKKAAKKAAASGKSFFGGLRRRPTARGKPNTSAASTPTAAAPAAKTITRRRGLTYEPGTAFVAMSFSGAGMDDSFAAIKAACKAVKLIARRVDEIYSSGVIILDIVDLIERAEFIIVDLTHERPNVYYELGYAHGIGNQPGNILLVAKQGTELHFDIAALRVHYYKSATHLRQLVTKALRFMIQEAKGK
jgi:nucleotide-binding universal stress UspA family protein